MSLSGVLGWGAESAFWLVPFLLMCALASVALSRLLPRPLAWVGLIGFTAVAAAIASTLLESAPREAVAFIAWVCSALSLLWSISAAVAGRLKSRPPTGAERRSNFAHVAHLAALVLAVPSAIILTTVLVMRIICVAFDLVSGVPWLGAPSFEFAGTGLWSVGFLFGSCAFGLGSTRDPRLPAWQLWCTGAMVAWACLLPPSYRPSVVGGPERTGSTLVLLASLSVLLLLASVICERFEPGSDRWPARGTGSQPVGNRSHTPAGFWPGFRSGCAALATGVILLVGFHMVIPVEIGGSGFRVSTFVTSGSAALAAVANLLLIARSWHRGLAEAALGLATLSVCGAALAFVPAHPRSLGEWYPLLFSAMIVGLASATGLWTWLSVFWAARADMCGPTTTTGRLVPYTKRFAFLSSALALIVAALLAVWPRLRSIAATDDDLGRVVIGLSANLFLLLVMLWCSRKLRRMTFHILTVFAVIMAAGFLVMRLLPFAGRFR